MRMSAEESEVSDSDDSATECEEGEVCEESSCAFCGEVDSSKKTACVHCGSNYCVDTCGCNCSGVIDLTDD